VHLADDGDGTVLTYNAKADVGGKLAQIGSRLVQGTAKKMADEFFGKFSRIVAERHVAEGVRPRDRDRPRRGTGRAGRGAGHAAAGRGAAERRRRDPARMNVEAAAGGVPPVVPPESVACRPATSPRRRRHRHAAGLRVRAAAAGVPRRLHGRARGVRAARAASTVAQPTAEPGLLQRPLTWVGIAVLVLALLFLIL
jgi:hypothetical protein